MAEKQTKPRMTSKQKIDWILSCRNEADQAKTDRMSQNKDNYNMYHLKYDFSHKEEGQSKDVLSKQSMAVETIKSFFQQALADIGDWWTAECRYPTPEELMLIKPEEVTKLTNYMLEKTGYFSHVGNSIQSALLGALTVSKVYGTMIDKPKYVVTTKGKGKSTKKVLEKVEDKTWQIRFDTVRQENYYPDPSGKGLYEIEDMWVDYHEVLAMSEGDDAIYDHEAVAELNLGTTTDSIEEYNKARETGQNTTNSGHRPKVKLTEFWGTIIHPTTGEIVHRNCVATIANDTVFIRKPTPNPLWHQSSPYKASPLLEVANSVWHKALMDAPTQHNKSLIEIYNLLVDAAMRQVHAISQIRKDSVDDVSQISNGIPPGTAIGVNSTLPIGAKVLEPLTQVQIPQEAFNIFNIQNQEFNASALTNDLRQGVMPFRAVKATEVVEASQTITSVFQGMAKNYEARQSSKELELAWMTTCQNWDKISKEEFQSLFGAARGEELSQMSPEDVFASTVNGFKFRVYGITMTLAKAQDFQKLATLLQIIGGSPVLMEAYASKYGIPQTLSEIMNSLNIDKTKLEIPKAEQATVGVTQGQTPPQPDQMSQVPQAAGMSMADMMGGPQIPSSQFPGSPATQGTGG